MLTRCILSTLDVQFHHSCSLDLQLGNVVDLILKTAFWDDRDRYLPHSVFNLAWRSSFCACVAIWISHRCRLVCDVKILMILPKWYIDNHSYILILTICIILWTKDEPVSQRHEEQDAIWEVRQTISGCRPPSDYVKSGSSSIPCFILRNIVVFHLSSLLIESYACNLSKNCSSTPASIASAKS